MEDLDRDGADQGRASGILRGRLHRNGLLLDHRGPLRQVVPHVVRATGVGVSVVRAEHELAVHAVVHVQEPDARLEDPARGDTESDPEEEARRSRDAAEPHGRPS